MAGVPPSSAGSISELPIWKRSRRVAPGFGVFLDFLDMIPQVYCKGSDEFSVATSELESIDIFLRKRKRLPKNHLVAANLDLPHAPRFKLRRSRPQSAARQPAGGIHRQITQIVGVPQDHRLNKPTVHVRPA